MSVFIRQHTNTVNSFSKESGWVILSDLEAGIKAKIEAAGVPLKDWDIKINYGIKTGFNEAFIINDDKRKELLKNCPEADAIIRPIIRGRAIEKYYNKLDNSYLIFTRRGIRIDEYMPIKDYLTNFYQDLIPKNNNELRGRKAGSYKWFEIQDNIAYWKDFEKPKIVWKRVGSVIRFSYDETGMYCLDSTCFATGNDLKFIVGYLNSTISKKELLRNSPQTGTGDVITSVQALEPHLIPKGTFEQNKSITKLVEQCIFLLKNDEFSDISFYEEQIDDIVSDILGLTLEEREIIG